MLQVCETAAKASSSGGPKSHGKPRFPQPVRFNHRKYFKRSAIDRFKAELEAFALGITPVYPPPRDPDLLVTVNSVVAEFGVTRRTIDNWVKSAEAACEP